jgi:hypothetical protein
VIFPQCAKIEKRLEGISNGLDRRASGKGKRIHFANAPENEKKMTQKKKKNDHTYFSYTTRHYRLGSEEFQEEKIEGNAKYKQQKKGEQ